MRRHIHMTVVFLNEFLGNEKTQAGSFAAFGAEQCRKKLF